jgi:hypothetical protein
MGWARAKSLPCLPGGPGWAAQARASLPPIKKVTNGQLSLEDVVAAISNKTLAIYKQLSMDEDGVFTDVD